jgi:hypothetical protein
MLPVPLLPLTPPIPLELSAINTGESRAAGAEEAAAAAKCGHVAAHSAERRYQTCLGTLGLFCAL